MEKPLFLIDSVPSEVLPFAEQRSKEDSANLSYLLDSLLVRCVLLC